MSTIELQLAIDRLKVKLVDPMLEEGQEKEEMRCKIVALQMKLRHLKDEEEDMVGVVSGWGEMRNQG